MIAYSTEIIPAMSIAEIVSYDMTNAKLVVKKPTATGLASEKLVIIPEAIKASGYGKAICYGVASIIVTPGLAIGSSVGSKASDWIGIAQDGGPFSILQISGTIAVVRFIGGGGSAIATIWAVITRGLQAAAPAGVPPEGYSSYLCTLVESPYTELSPLPIGQESEIADIVATPPDMRKFLQWYQVGDIVPLITRVIDEETVYFFAQQMIRVQEEDEETIRSLMFNPTDSRAMAVFGDGGEE